MAFYEMPKFFFDGHSEPIVSQKMYFVQTRMQKQKPDIDIVNEVLEECVMAYPISSFVIGLYQQYQRRGSLSKKQLEGLHSKASKIQTIHPGKLATLEALIKKMRTRYNSEPPQVKPMYEKDKLAGELISSVLEKYPQHKRVLFLRSKYENNETLSALEMDELKRFCQLLNK